MAGAPFCSAHEQQRGAGAAAGLCDQAGITDSGAETGARLLACSPAHTPASCVHPYRLPHSHTHFASTLPLPLSPPQLNDLAVLWISSMAVMLLCQQVERVFRLSGTQQV